MAEPTKKAPEVDKLSDEEWKELRYICGGIYQDGQSHCPIDEHIRDRMKRQLIPLIFRVCRRRGK